MREYIEDLDEEAARKIALALDTDREPAWNLVGWIDILFGLFQSVDRRGSSGKYGHEFYEQREWRIGQLFGPHVLCSRLNAEVSGLDGCAALSGMEREGLRAALKYLDPVFFTDERLDGSGMLWGTADSDGNKDAPFFSFVEEVICPKSAECQVATLMDELGFGVRKEVTIRHQSTQKAYVTFAKGGAS